MNLKYKMICISILYMNAIHITFIVWIMHHSWLLKEQVSNWVPSWLREAHGYFIPQFINKSWNSLNACLKLEGAYFHSLTLRRSDGKWFSNKERVFPLSWSLWLSNLEEVLEGHVTWLVSNGAINACGSLPYEAFSSFYEWKCLSWWIIKSVARLKGVTKKKTNL